MSDLTNEFAVLRTPILFERRPEPLPPDLRPIWRIAVLLLLLHHASRGAKSSFKRLYVLDWILQSRNNTATFEEILLGKVEPHGVFVRVDPALNRAVDLAIGEGLVEIISGSRVHLTDKGESLAVAIMAQNNVLQSEKARITSIGKAVTEGLVARMLSSR